LYTDGVKKEERKGDETLANSIKQSTQQKQRGKGKERKGFKRRKKKPNNTEECLSYVSKGIRSY
jgi:hypothetical protein